MTEIAGITDQLERAYHGGAWHGPAVFEILSGVTAKQAGSKPIAAAHSIWEIVLHLITWNDVARRRLAGHTVEPTDAEDWPPVADRSESSWQKSIVALEDSVQNLQAAISNTDDSHLHRPTAGRDHTNFSMLHGVIQHALYHAGQIALLKK